MSRISKTKLVPALTLAQPPALGAEPDVRGWEVVAADGRRVGTVRDLLLDPRSLRVRSLEVAVDEQQAGAAGRIAAISADAARPDAASRCVLLPGTTSAQVVALPEYALRVLHGAVDDAPTGGEAAPAAERRQLRRRAEDRATSDERG